MEKPKFKEGMRVIIGELSMQTLVEELKLHEMGLPNEYVRFRGRIPNTTGTIISPAEFRQYVMTYPDDQFERYRHTHSLECKEKLESAGQWYVVYTRLGMVTTTYCNYHESELTLEPHPLLDWMETI